MLDEQAHEPEASEWLLARVHGMRLETDEIRSFELVPAAGDVHMDWTPGAHVELRLSRGLVRHYSLYNAPNERNCLRIAVKLDGVSRGGSQAMHELGLGDAVEMRRPRNLFELDRSARRPVLLAGGIGITPLLSMWEDCRSRSVTARLHYFARCAADAAFAPYLCERAEAWGAEVDFHFGLTPAATAEVLSQVLGNARRMDGDAVYVCGPSAFMDCAVSQAQRGGWPKDRVFLESFGGSVMKTPSSEQPLNEQAFEVVLHRSGVRCEVAVGESIVAAAARAGAFLPTACEMGECGACLTRILQGRPDHRDALLNSEEREAGLTMLPCVSRSLDRLLVLDC